MKTKKVLILGAPAGLILAAIVWMTVPQRSQTAGSVAMYTDSDLLIRKHSSGPKLTRFLQHRVLPKLPPSEQAIASTIRLEFPLRAGSHPGDWLNVQAKLPNKVIRIPVQTIQFLDDLCIATAWLEHNNEPLDRLYEYLAMLKYRTPAQLGLSCFPDPCTALAIPSHAMDTPAVHNLVEKLYGSSMAWLLAHELAHILKNHRSESAIPIRAVVADEAEADDFANQLMKSIGVAPIGLALFFQARFVLERNRFDFPSETAWSEHLREERTHPLSSDRLGVVSSYIQTHAVEFVRHEPSLSPSDMRRIALQLARIATLLEDPENLSKLQRLGQTASPAGLAANRTPVERFVPIP